VRTPLPFIVIAAALLALGLPVLRARQAELAQARSLEDSRYVSSTQCRQCHPDKYASWHRTYHRSMTREADASSVLGAFDGRSLDYLGVRARMQRGPDGGYEMSFRPADSRAETRVRVERTVGSHRYQQYLARDGDLYFRLPIAWDVGARRFIHMNSAFLTPDPALAPDAVVSNVDYNRHVTRWNDNCVFCHNVRPSPGLEQASGRFDTQVAELGVACEACHGPGAEHVAQNREPLRRYLLHLGGAPDPSIRNPRRMSAERSSEVCGRCHGQRITSDIDRFQRDGDPFIPGEELGHYSRPLARETRQNGEPGLFRARFWPDGTARLTAYELQGQLQSPCRQSDRFSCESCHAMHEGEPAGQLRPGAQGDGACTGCHARLSTPLAAADHSGHRAGSPGSACRNCHMPDIVYGLVSVHLSHRIEVPDVARDHAASRPDACTLCHVDRTRSWAARASHASAPADDPAERAGLSEVAYRLLAGDPIERAIAAHALGKPEAQHAPEYRAQRLGLLQSTLLDDPYPAVRAIAQRSLASVLATHAEARRLAAAYDPTARRSERQRQVSALLAAAPAEQVLPPSTQVMLALRGQADAVAIEIGE
jgi:predicted CXXCH cytochrome family protein